MSDDDPLRRIETALHHATEIAAHGAEHDEDLREIRQLHRHLMVAVGKASDAQRLSDDNINSLIERVERIVRRRSQEA